MLMLVVLMRLVVFSLLLSLSWQPLEERRKYILLICAMKRRKLIWRFTFAINGYDGKGWTSVEHEKIDKVWSGKNSWIFDSFALLIKALNQFFKTKIFFHLANCEKHFHRINPKGKRISKAELLTRKSFIAAQDISIFWYSRSNISALYNLGMFS